jgi:hypothetical protein
MCEDSIRVIAANCGKKNADLCMIYDPGEDEVSFYVDFGGAIRPAKPSNALKILKNYNIELYNLIFGNNTIYCG